MDWSTDGAWVRVTGPGLASRSGLPMDRRTASRSGQPMGRVLGIETARCSACRLGQQRVGLRAARSAMRWEGCWVFELGPRWALVMAARLALWSALG